ncbi:unnamed protein product [Closterium sp. NIES-53]
MAGFNCFPDQSGPFDGSGSQFFTEESQTIGTDDQPLPVNSRDRTSSAQVDIRFLRRLLALLRLAGAKYAVILLLLALANIPIVAKMGTVTGTFYFALVNANPDAFLKTLGNSAIWLTLAAVSTALTDWSAQFLCLKWRKTLTSACHVAYRRSSWLYFASLEKCGTSAVHNAATKAQAPSVPVIDNPDQRITEDIHRFAEQVSLLLSRTVTAPLTVLYYSCWVVSLIGPTGLLIILIFFTIGAVITRRVMSPVAALVAEQERREAEFRMAHVRVKERSEDILFSRGEDAEACHLSAELAAVLANQEKLVWRYLKLGITTKVFDYAGVAVNYLALAAPVFGIVGAGIAGGGGDSKDKGAVAQWISNASFAILQLIFGGSQIIDAARIISDSAGYTARVGELFESLQLLPSDRLQSHSVQTHGRDAPFPPPTPPAEAAAAAAAAVAAAPSPAALASSPLSKKRGIWEILTGRKRAGYTRRGGNVDVSEVTGLLDVRVDGGRCGGGSSSAGSSSQHKQSVAIVPARQAGEKETGYGTWEEGSGGAVGVSTRSGAEELVCEGRCEHTRMTLCGGESMVHQPREFMLQEPTWLMVPSGWEPCCHNSVPAFMERPYSGESADGYFNACPPMHPILQYSIHSVPPELQSLVGALLPPQPGDGWGKGEKRRAAARVGEAWGVSVEDVIVGDVGVEGAEIEEVRVDKVRVEDVTLRDGGLEGVKMEEVRVEDVKIVVTFQCSDVPLWPIHNNSSSSAAGASASAAVAAAAAAAVSEVATADGASAHAGVSPADSATATQADVSRAMNRLLFNFRLFQQQLCEHIWAAGHWADAVDPLTGYLMHSAPGSGGSSSGRAIFGDSKGGDGGSGGSGGNGRGGSRWPFPALIKYNEVDIAQILLGYPVAPTAMNSGEAAAASLGSTVPPTAAEAAAAGGATQPAIPAQPATPTAPAAPPMPSCPLVLHPSFGTHTYPASLLTTAPLPLLQSAIRHVAGSGWRLPGWQEEPGILVVGQGTGDGKQRGETVTGKGEEGGCEDMLVAPEPQSEPESRPEPGPEVQPPCHTCSPSSFPPALSLSYLTLTLPQTNHLIVANLSLHLPRGKALLVTGPSGCGKTSLLRAIAGLWPTSSCHVSSSSSRIPSAAIPTPPVTLYPPGTSSHVMFLPQKPLLAPSPCLAAQVIGMRDERVMMWGGRGRRDERVRAKMEAALAVVHLTHLLPRLVALCDDGLVEYEDDSAGKRRHCEQHQVEQQQGHANPGMSLERSGMARSWIEGLSPGEQQRLQFARVVFHQPWLVFLDEATSAVDGEMEARMYAWLAMAGVAIVSVSHRRESLRRWHHAELVLKGDGTGRWRIMQ